jgi:glycosyltransferase involved in cell wall biosynthesis
MVLPSDQRASMDRYGHELANAINRWVPDFVAHTVTLAEKRRVPTGKAFARFLRAYRRYVEYPLLARSGTPDIHHIIDHSYGHLVHVLDPHRTVATCHDLMLIKLRDGIVPGVTPSQLTVLTFRLSVASLRRCRLLLANSYNSRNDFTRFLKMDPRRIRVVYLGVDEKFQRPALSEVQEARRALKLIDPQRTFLLNVSTGAVYKNSEGSILTLAELVSRGRQEVFLLRAGQRLNDQQLALAETLGVRNRVIELGTVPEEHMPFVYWVSSALLFPSYYEGFGWPVLEAMACGVPVVTSNAPTILEVSGRIPASLPPKDVTGMADAIERLLDDTSFRAQQVDRGLAWVRQFSWQRTAKETTDVYAEVAEWATPLFPAT